MLRFVVPALGFPRPRSATAARRAPPAAASTACGDMVRLSLDSITAVPSRRCAWPPVIGLLGGVLAVLVGAALVAHWTGHTLPGWTSTVAIVSGFSALQLHLPRASSGEYLGRTYTFLQNWPTYSVAFDSDEVEVGTDLGRTVPAPVRSDT